MNPITTRTKAILVKVVTFIKSISSNGSCGTRPNGDKFLIQSGNCNNPLSKQQICYIGKVVIIFAIKTSQNYFFENISSKKKTSGFYHENHMHLSLFIGEILQKTTTL